MKYELSYGKLYFLNIDKDSQLCLMQVPDYSCTAVTATLFIWGVEGNPLLYQKNIILDIAGPLVLLRLSLFTEVVLQPFTGAVECSVFQSLCGSIFILFFLFCSSHIVGLVLCICKT